MLRSTLASRPWLQIAVACGLLILPRVVAAQADPISGTWKGEVGPNDGAPTTITMELKFDGKSAVTGAIIGFPTPGEVKAGTYDLQTRRLRIEGGATDNAQVLLVFEGTVVRNTVTGSAKRGDGGGLGSFILAKADGGSAPAPGTNEAAAALRGGFAEVSGWVTKAAELVPAEKYTYRPVATVRTFGQLVAHLVDAYAYYCAQAAGQTVQWSDSAEKGATTKAALAPKLKQATDACAAAYANAGAKAMPLVANVGHTSLHYGNMITYLRMLGLRPPST